MLSVKCKYTMYNPHCEVSIDEVMIAFQREVIHEAVCAQERGFKVWVRADAVSGYVSEVDVYTGKVPGERVWLGGNVVRRSTRNITGRHHAVYCDNFFHQC